MIFKRKKLVVLFYFILLFCNQLLKGQIIPANTFTIPVGSKIPIKIIAHTDSSVFFVGKKVAENNIWDLYISKHSAFKNQVDFEVCLDIRKVFKGSFNTESLNIEYLQCKNNIVFLFTAVSSLNKILFAKIVSFEGEVSEAYIIDKTDYTNENLESCFYSYYLTSKKNIFIFNHREYKSGFSRDKCILIDNYLNKIWDYELPAINSHIQENLIADIDNANNLIFYNLFFDTYKYMKNNRMVSQKVYNYEKSDTTVNLKLGNLNYKIINRKDSIQLFFVNPFKKEVVVRKLFYPFQQFPIIKSITSSQLLMYNMVDIDDENFIFPGKKAMYYKRFDLKNNTVLLDTLILLNNDLQNKLSYNYGSGGRRVTGKYFKLMSENLIDGKLISTFEHVYNGQYLELFVSNYNVTQNNFEWMQLIPRKINIYYPNLYDISLRYFDDKFSVSFYEHMKNTQVNCMNIDFDRYKLLRKQSTKVFVSYTFSTNGEVVKDVNKNIDDKFMFPWLSQKKEVDPNHFFIKRDFLPLNFLYKN